MNASALQAESKKLAAEAGSLDAGQLAGQASRIADKTEEIRKQAAGALDEAHISSAGDRLCMGRVQMARLVNVRICRTNYEAKDSTAVETPLRP